MNNTLDKILDIVGPIDFESIANPNLVPIQEELNKIIETLGEEYSTYPSWAKAKIKKLRAMLKGCKVTPKQQVVAVIRELKKVFVSNPIRQTKGSFWSWDYGYWHQMDDKDMLLFFSDVAAKMGVPSIDADHNQYRESLFNNAVYEYHDPEPPPSHFETYVSLLNGYVRITKKGVELINPIPELFITYRLPYTYDPDADCPQFEKFFNKVRPGEDWQRIIMEYIGYVFSNGIKLERAMLIYGSGANGKSVFYEIIRALVGKENFTSYSLEGLTDEAGNQRAAIEGKLLNYSSEISKRMNVDMFKQMISGEAIQARRLYKDNENIHRYAKLMFNCNELPVNTDSSNAYYRRMIIVPFDATIPSVEQDPDLHRKIIGKAHMLDDKQLEVYKHLTAAHKGELSGVFNLAMEGLQRLYQNMKFSETPETKAPVNQYALESNSALMFFDEIGLTQNNEGRIVLKELHAEYKKWCEESGYRPIAVRGFSKMLKQNEYQMVKYGYGLVLYASKAGSIQADAHEYLGIVEKLPF